MFPSAKATVSVLGHSYHGERIGINATWFEGCGRCCPDTDRRVRGRME